MLNFNLKKILDEINVQKLEANGKNSPRANCSLFTHACVCVCV